MAAHGLKIAKMGESEMGKTAATQNVGYIMTRVIARKSPFVWDELSSENCQTALPRNVFVVYINSPPSEQLGDLEAS